MDHALRISRRRLLLAARPDPLATVVPRERVADSLQAAVATADHTEPFECERGPRTIPHEMFQGLKIDTQWGTKERDPHAGVD